VHADSDCIMAPSSPTVTLPSGVKLRLRRRQPLAMEPPPHEREAYGQQHSAEVGQGAKTRRWVAPAALIAGVVLAASIVTANTGLSGAGVAPAEPTAQPTAQATALPTAQPASAVEAAEEAWHRCELMGESGVSSLPTSAINDDYCDCADGSDEPATAACAGLVAATFQCRSAEESVSVSRVGDGVCDCCDGSDEAAGSCEDTCSIVQQLAEADTARRQRGEEAKRRYLAAAAADPGSLTRHDVDLRAAPAFAALAGGCWAQEAEAGEYAYKLCLFANASQGRRDGGRAATSIGRRWSWLEGMEGQLVEPAAACVDSRPQCTAWAASGECARNPNFMLHQCKASCAQCADEPTPPPEPEAATSGRTARFVGLLSGGDRCGGATARSLRVEFECGERERLGAVHEREMCAYSTVFETPAVC